MKFKIYTTECIFIPLQKGNVFFVNVFLLKESLKIIALKVLRLHRGVNQNYHKINFFNNNLVEFNQIIFCLQPSLKNLI
jgi:hypothetical protein